MIDVIPLLRRETGVDAGTMLSWSIGVIGAGQEGYILLS